MKNIEINCKNMGIKWMKCLRIIKYEISLNKAKMMKYVIKSISNKKNRNILPVTLKKQRLFADLLSQ